MTSSSAPKFSIGDRVRFRDPEHVAPVFATSRGAVDLRAVFVITAIRPPYGEHEVELYNEKDRDTVWTRLREIELASN